jgi:type IV pilus assembly protein PilA
MSVFSDISRRMGKFRGAGQGIGPTRPRDSSTHETLKEVLMLHILKNRRDQARSADEGFTLIELMVVVLIIAILLAIAIPTFLGAQNKAKDRSAQSSVRNALTAAKTIYTDASTYTTADETALALVEPSLTFAATATNSTDPKTVSVSSNTTGDTFYAAAMSKTGTCFYIKDTIATGGGTTYAKTDPTDGACSGSSASTQTFTASW